MRRLLAAIAAALLVSAAGCVTAQDLDLPPRGAGARRGSELLPLLRGLSVESRERLLWQEFAAGNVPSFLRRFVPVTVSRADAAGRMRTVQIAVAPDHLALGDDADFFRMPMTPRLAQQLCDRLGCSMPTRRIVDDVWRAAPVQLDPVPFDPARYDIVAPDVFWLSQQAIEQQRAGRPLGLLVAGVKKDVVIAARLATVTGRVVIYGWHRRDGRPIQPLYSGHGEGYADYSHGVRPVADRVFVDGVATTLQAVLADPVLHPLLSDEGPVTVPRYAAPPPDETFPFVDGFAPTGFALRSWRAKFTPATLQPFAPTAPGGDGHVVVVRDPRGGTDSLRCGSATTTDQIAQADVWCAYRPELAADGFERVGVFVRDRAAGAFDGTRSQAGACYALTYDSHDGRVQCLRVAGGVLTDLAPAPIHRRSSAWRRLRIEARADRLRFVVDGEAVLETRDATHRSGECGIGHHDYFRTLGNARGTRADHWFADVPDALGMSIDDGGGRGPLAVAMARGVPGDLALCAFTVAPGAFPRGWLYGLDPTLADLAAQWGSGAAPFVDVFGAAGTTRTVLPIAWPPGLTLYAVALDVLPPGSFATFPAVGPVATSPPRAFRLR